MADFKRLTDRFSVAAQIAPEDVARAAAAGFRTIVVNRPDGEDAGQPKTAAMRALAEAEGLVFHEIPVSGPPTPEAVAKTAAVIAGAPGPVLAYCRSGTRSTTLWALATAQAGTLAPDAILAAAAGAGYDLAALRPRLEALAAGGT